jgi:hypothetical protein
VTWYFDVTFAIVRAFPYFITDEILGAKPLIESRAREFRKPEKISAHSWR